MIKYTIIEVGANKGTDTIRFIEMMNSHVYAFEPIPFLCEAIRKNHSANNLEVFNLAVSDFNGKAKFGISDPTKGAMDYGCSSLFTFTKGIENLWSNRGDFNFVETIDVEVIRMDTFLEEKGITHVDYLHCDAQGGDLKVLKSFGNKLNLLKSGVVEASNSVSLYEVDNSAKSIVLFLEENGFKILNKNELESAAYEIDIKFEKL